MLFDRASAMRQQRSLRGPSNPKAKPGPRRKTRTGLRDFNEEVAILQELTDMGNGPTGLSPEF